MLSFTKLLMNRQHYVYFKIYLGAKISLLYINEVMFHNNSIKLRSHEED